MVQRYLTLYSRLVANSAEPESPCGCWIWTGRTKPTRNGRYGCINVRLGGRHRTFMPHRVMVECMLGLPPGGLPYGVQVDHLCVDTLCINPDHLEPVSEEINIARMWATRRGLCTSDVLQPPGTLPEFSSSDLPIPLFT